jgi:hypothetical protein
VTVSTTPAPTAAIQATLQGSNAVVTWQTTNAVSATINGVSVAVSGTTSVAVSATTTFTIVARNAAGQTATASATVNVPPPTGTTPPLAPVDLRPTVSGSRITLSWRAPASGAAPTEYLLDVGTRSGKSDVASGYLVGNVLTVSAQLPRGRYYARVRGRNAYGTSSPSNETSFRIGTWLASPTGVRVTWQGTLATISWTAPTADSPDLVPSTYVLEAGTGPGLADVATVPLGNVNRFTVDIPAGAYYVRLRAANANGDSDPTPDLVVAAPGTAQAPRTLAAGGSGPMVDLSWTPPASGETPLGYIIEAGSEPGLANLARMQVGNVTRFSTPAPPGTYFVRVRAVNSRGPGLPSNEVVVQK